MLWELLKLLKKESKEITITQKLVRNGVLTTKLNTNYSSMDKKLQACWDNYAIDNDYAKLWRFRAHCTKI